MSIILRGVIQRETTSRGRRWHALHCSAQSVRWSLADVDEVQTGMVHLNFSFEHWGSLARFFHLCVDYFPRWITTVRARPQSRSDGRMQHSGCLAAGGWPTWRSQPPLPCRSAAALVLVGVLKINRNPTDGANQTNKSEPCFQGSACSVPAWPPGWSSRCWRMRASRSKRCGAGLRRRRRS